MSANRTMLLALPVLWGSIWPQPGGVAMGQAAGPPPGPGPTASSTAPAVDVWRPVGRIEHPPIKECSGIVASRRYPGIFWVHNDSGNPPVLFAIKESGELVAEVPVEGATNADWEDIAIDDGGHLFVGDIGNNFHVFPIRTVYEIAEPNPHAARVKPARVIAKHKYRYLQDRFDAEGLCVLGGSILVVPRARTNKTVLYRLEPAHGGKYEPVEDGGLPIGGITGAEVSADGKELAACTPWALYVFALDDQGRPVAHRPPLVVRFSGGGIEACCFDGEDVVLASEHRTIYRVTRAHLKAGTRFERPR